MSYPPEKKDDFRGGSLIRVAADQGCSKHVQVNRGNESSGIMKCRINLHAIQVISGNTQDGIRRKKIKMDKAGPAFNQNAFFKHKNAFQSLFLPFLLV